MIGLRSDARAGFFVLVNPERDMVRLVELNIFQMCKINEKRECRACKIVFMICLIISIGLIIAGFLVPPTGIIDGSVLTAVGELIAFPAIGFGFRAVELGYDMRINHGNTTIEIDND